MNPMPGSEYRRLGPANRCPDVSQSYVRVYMSVCELVDGRLLYVH
jgi:hypothetical protein